MTGLVGILSGLWGRLAGVAVALGAFLLVLARVRQSGRDAERADATERALERVKERQDVEDTIARMDADDRQRLRDKWTRPD